jgi:ribosomal protein S18 acetylase RimI-like enzyme
MNYGWSIVDHGNRWQRDVIHGRHRRRGYGREPARAALAVLTDAGGHRGFALSDHPDDPAWHLYLRLGSSESGERTGDEAVARPSLT